MFCTGVLGTYNYAVCSSTLCLAVATVKPFFSLWFLQHIHLSLKTVHVVRLAAVDTLFLLEIFWSEFLRYL